MEFIISKSVRDLGIEALGIVIEGVSVVNKKNALQDEKNQAIASLQRNEQAIAGYEELHKIIGQPSLEPPALWLDRIVQASGRLPTINTLVDSYNLVSYKTGIAFGAHDASKIIGNPTLVLPMTRPFTPLGKMELEQYLSSEYGCQDEEKVLCRLEIKQCDQTKITKDTTSAFVYCQGNPRIPKDQLESALNLAAEKIIQYCDGKITSKTQ